MFVSIVSALRAMIMLVLVTSGLGQVSSPPAPSYHFASGGAALNAPVELIANGLVFVRAKVNDHPGWFIVDNASQSFTVDRDFARQIALTTSGSATARGGGANAIDAGVIRDVQISLPGLELTHRNLIAIALKPLEPSLARQ
jgi:hypothetical protein